MSALGTNTASLCIWCLFVLLLLSFPPLGAILKFWRNELLQPEQQGWNSVYFLWNCLELILENQIVPGWCSQLTRARNNSKPTPFFVFNRHTQLCEECDRSSLEISVRDFLGEKQIIFLIFETKISVFNFISELQSSAPGFLSHVFPGMKMAQSPTSCSCNTWGGAAAI